MESNQQIEEAKVPDGMPKINEHGEVEPPLQRGISKDDEFGNFVHEGKKMTPAELHKI